MLLRCLEEEYSRKVLYELHDGPSGRHFGRDTTADKILRAGYYWPKVFKYAHVYAHKCLIFQTCASRQRKPTNPLEPVIVDKPLQQWGIDVINEINLHSSMQQSYILTATNYFTMWV